MLVIIQYITFKVDLYGSLYQVPAMKRLHSQNQENVKERMGRAAGYEQRRPNPTTLQVWFSQGPKPEKTFSVALLNRL